MAVSLLFDSSPSQEALPEKRLNSVHLNEGKVEEENELRPVLMPFADCVAAFLSDGSTSHFMFVSSDVFKDLHLHAAALPAVNKKQFSHLRFTRRAQPEWNKTRYVSDVVSHLHFDGSCHAFGIVINRCDLHLYKGGESITTLERCSRGSRPSLPSRQAGAIIIGPIRLCNFGVDDCTSILAHPTDPSVLITVGYSTHHMVGQRRETLSFLRLRQDERRSYTEQVLTLLWQVTLPRSVGWFPYRLVPLPDMRHIIIVRKSSVTEGPIAHWTTQLTVFDTVGLCENSRATSALCLAMMTLGPVSSSPNVVGQSDSDSLWCWPKEGALLLYPNVPPPSVRKPIQDKTLHELGLYWLVSLSVGHTQAAIDPSTEDLLVQEAPSSSVVRLRSLEQECSEGEGSSHHESDSLPLKSASAEVLRIAFV